MRPDITVLATVICVVLLSGCVNQLGISGERQESEEVFENSLSAEELSLAFESHNGFIEVLLWDESGYRIEVTKWARASSAEEARRIADSLQVNFDEDTGRETTLEMDIEQKDNTGADFRAYIPSISLNTLDLKTSNGYISIKDALTANDISLTTSNGYISASCSARTLSVSTSNGQITGFFEGEHVEIETSNGRVDIQCGDGVYTIATSNGSVDIETGNSGSYDITSSNGRVTVTAQEDFSFDLSTSHASIDIQVAPVTYTIDERTHKKGYTAQGASVSISVETSNGSITVHS
jgi:DUF4097 and DUF4098 domain-containing protein YvlB